MTATEFKKLKGAICNFNRGCGGDHCPLIVTCGTDRHCAREEFTKEETITALNKADKEFFIARMETPAKWDVIAKHLNGIILE